MAKRRAAATHGDRALTAREEPRSLVLAAKGIHTSRDFATLMSALLSDVATGRVTPSVSNAIAARASRALRRALATVSDVS